MNKLLIFVIFIVSISTFSIEGIALDPSDTQVSIKMRGMGSDPSTGGSRVNITITTNMIGNLVYVEEYYTPGSSGTPNFCCGSRYESIMNDYTISFDLKRPDHDHWQKWSLVKSKVLIDGVIVYDAWTGTGGTYKSFNPETSSDKNNSVAPVEKIKPDKPKATEQFADIVHEDNSTDGINDIGNMKPMYNISSAEGTKQVPMIGMSTIIILMLSISIFRRMNR